MTVMEHCDVHFVDGNIIRDTPILFKDNGWIRIGEGPEYNWFPPGGVNHVTKRGEDDA